MQSKTLFKTSSSISYSQFLQSKEQHVHCLTDIKDPSVDIEFFKQSISLHYQHEYAKQKWQNWVYRFIFFGFGLLFLVLGIIIFFKTANFACGFYVKNCGFVKNCINIVCLLLAGGAFTTGFRIHPEKEAFEHLVSKVGRELNSPAKHLQIEFNAIIANLSHECVTPLQTLWINKTANARHHSKSISKI